MDNSLLAVRVINHKYIVVEKREVELGTYSEEMDTYLIKSGLEVTDYIAYPEDSLEEGMLCTQYEDMSMDAEQENDVSMDAGEVLIDEGEGPLTDDEVEVIPEDGATSTLEVK